MKNFKSSLTFIIILILTLVSCDDSDDVVENNQIINVEAKGNASKTKDCATIKDGTIVDENGTIITMGFNEDGYNYQAKRYSGEMFPDTSPGWFLEWNWNEAYLATIDCDGDNRLDYANGQDNYRGTGAWTTTKWTKTYISNEGKACRVSQFTKYIAVPEDATSDGEYFYNSDKSVIGQVVNSEGFEDFAKIQLIWNDPCQGINGVDYKAPGPVGLGNR